MKHLCRLFLTLSLLVCLVPFAGMSLRPTVESAENRVLSAFPSFTKRDGRVNIAFFQQFDTWFSEHFAFRNELVFLDSVVQSDIFHSSANEKVIVGRDGWLYYASTLPDYQGTGLISEREICSMAHNLKLTERFVREHGAKLLLAFPANKNTLYGDFMPWYCPAPDGTAHNLFRLQDRLAVLGLPYADLHGLFSKEPEILYHRQDSHWNSKGAMLAYTLMMDRLSLLFLLCLLPLLLCACGGKQTVTIFDSGVTTTLELSLPRTVRSVLDRAEITLRDGDEVIPPPDTMLREAGEITVRREAVVLLNVYGEVRTVVAYGLTAGQLLEREGITLREGQHLSCDPGTYLKSGMELKVSDMVNVHLIHDGTEEYTAVAAKTVGEALSERGVLLSLEDRVTPAAGTAVTDGMNITVQRIRYEEEELTEPMPFETQYEKDETLPFDSEQVSVEGRDGLHRVRYRVIFADGAEEGREPLSEVVLEPPVTQIIKKGPKDLSVVSIVSQKVFYDCDGSGHGYYEIHYSDDTVEYERF